MKIAANPIHRRLIEDGSGGDQEAEWAESDVVQHQSVSAEKGGFKRNELFQARRPEAAIW
jgi:hypothetical protein